MQGSPVEPQAGAGEYNFSAEQESAGSDERREILERLRALEEQGADYNDRAAHREAVINRLHEENEGLRKDLQRSVFDPIVADLIRLFDGVSKDLDRLSGDGADPRIVDLLVSYADDLELILDRCGIEPFSAAVGDSLVVSEHTVVGIVETAEESRNNTVASVVAAGFRERATGRVKRPVKAHFYRYSQPIGSSVPETKETLPHA
jgi:molecular chaperone GrpE